MSFSNLRFLLLERINETSGKKKPKPVKRDAWMASLPLGDMQADIEWLKRKLDAGADEALMLDIHGFVNTTNACNFFIVRKGEVWTSTGDYCMNGITRQKVIDLCRANDIPVFEKNFSLYEAYGAEEAFLTGSFGAQTPVASIDGKPVGHPFE